VLRARVSGYLDKVLFKEGSEVQQGSPLFAIDPRPYAAEVDRADAQLALAEAHLKRADADFERAKGQLAVKAISREEYDKFAGDRAEAEAGIHVARASRDLARLNLEFTKVLAPVSGRIGRRPVGPGALVRADDPPLATLVVADPLYATFPISERTALQLLRAAQEAKPQATPADKVPIVVGVGDEKDFPRRATLDFMDNRVDPQTGTLQLRAVLPNDQGLLLP